MGSFTSDDHLPPTIFANFDVNLQRFYLEALNKEFDIQNKQNARNIKEALKEVVEAYKKRTGDGPDLAKSIRFDSSAKRCAYVLKHSPCFTSAVARHVYGLVKECPRAFRNVILKGEANICCLGGGPASDAVGACKVLSALCWQFRRKPLKLKVTVVDLNEDWAETAGNVLGILKDMPEVLGMEGVEVSFDFFTADLTRPFETAVRKVMGSADMVTMVYFLSAVNRGRDKIESFRMVKEIMKCMRIGAILFFLDSAMDVHYKQMSSAAESLGNLAEIYGPRIEEFHTLSLDSVRRFFELYKKDFGKFLCLTNCFVSSSAWHKTNASSVECKCRSCTTTMDNTGEYGKSHSLLLDKLQLDKSETWPVNTLKDKTSTKDKAIKPLSDKMERLLLDKSEIWSINTLQDKSSTNDKGVTSLSDKMDRSLLDESKMNNCQMVGKLLRDRCSLFVQEDGLVWRKSQRQAVSLLTAKMVQFRAQIGRLLADEFEQLDGEVENEVFDEIEHPSDDAFDSLLTEYFHYVPEYFFQTKSKKKRIFTGLPVSI